MSHRRPYDDRAGPGVAVVDANVPDDTWQAIGLDSVRAARMAAGGENRTRRWGASASTTALWSGLPAHPQLRIADRGEERSTALAARSSPRRVPGEDIVVIGRTTPVEPEGGVARSGRKRWRELFFLTILGLSLLGAWQSGRLNGVQKVIIVPAPESRRSMIA